MKSKKNKISLSRPSSSSDSMKVNLKKAKRNERFTFNFSFITDDKKYSLSGLESKDRKIHKKLLLTIERLSKMDKTSVYILPKEQGIEQLSEAEVSFRINSEFVRTGRNDEIGEGFWIFRLNDLGRVIGKINDNVFYILAIDTSFSTYKH